MTRLIRAELLKLRRRRSLVAWSWILTVGGVTAMFVLTALFRTDAQGVHQPAGGVANFQNALYFLTRMGSVAAVMVGATIGSGDLVAGVFRDLVTSGRSRVSLFAARVPAVMAGVLGPALGGVVVAAVLATVLRGHLPAPGLSEIAQGAGFVAAAMLLNGLLGLGLGAVTNRAGTVIGVLLAAELAVTPILEHVTALRSARELVPQLAVDHFQPGDPQFPGMSGVIAAAVVAAWALALVAAGAWRTRTQDA
jgi:hypothetical protein